MTILMRVLQVGLVKLMILISLIKPLVLIQILDLIKRLDLFSQYPQYEISGNLLRHQQQIQRILILSQPLEGLILCGIR